MGELANVVKNAQKLPVGKKILKKGGEGKRKKKGEEEKKGKKFSCIF